MISAVKAAALGPAQVHAQQHLGPVLRLGAAGAGVDGEKNVGAVVLAGEQGADLLGVDLGGKLLQVAADLGEGVEVPLAEQFEEDLDVVQPQFDRLPEVQLDQQAVALARHGGRGRRVAPEGRLGDLGVQGLEPLPESREVKGASSGRPPSRAPRRSGPSTRVRCPWPPASSSPALLKIRILPYLRSARERPKHPPPARRGPGAPRCLIPMAALRYVRRKPGSPSTRPSREEGP